MVEINNADVMKPVRKPFLYAQIPSEKKPSTGPKRKEKHEEKSKEPSKPLEEPHPGVQNEESDVYWNSNYPVQEGNSTTPFNTPVVIHPFNGQQIQASPTTQTPVELEKKEEPLCFIRNAHQIIGTRVELSADDTIKVEFPGKAAIKWLRATQGPPLNGPPLLEKNENEALVHIHKAINAIYEPIDPEKSAKQDNLPKSTQTKYQYGSHKKSNSNWSRNSQNEHKQQEPRSQEPRQSNQETHPRNANPQPVIHERRLSSSKPVQEVIYNFTTQAPPIHQPSHQQAGAQNSQQPGHPHQLYQAQYHSLPQYYIPPPGQQFVDPRSIPYQGYGGQMGYPPMNGQAPATQGINQQAPPHQGQGGYQH